MTLLRVTPPDRKIPKFCIWFVAPSMLTITVLPAATLIFRVWMLEITLPGTVKTTNLPLAPVPSSVSPPHCVTAVPLAGRAASEAERSYRNARAAAKSTGVPRYSRPATVPLLVTSAEPPYTALPW